MKEIRRARLTDLFYWLPLPLISLISLCLFSCATIPELQVLYRPAPPLKHLEGRAVALRVEDKRASKRILGQGAVKEFKGFSGNVSLSVARADENESRMGIFSVPDLMREAFRIRLERLGVKVLSGPARGKPELVIVLREFSLDLEGWQWIARMGYEARIVKGGVTLASQSINGQAQRFQSLGRESADLLMGEIFSDSMNALNLPRLFTQAGV
ncbi:MAG: hypothetical protein JRJ09_06375 [Deltaproteobacteria bacterium]|nr:hypothetical protein [Deltaproteobacteria bacterium]MBW2048140.1 hypothetical protein [Deltaproteobacteria bacterium]MBW2110880.1 hypothetical protein [Deltaproteobacteria bacterium]MBW2353917.1 hypothetical protein [Deltaproteobacteria bacterium]